MPFFEFISKQDCFLYILYLSQHIFLFTSENTSPIFLPYNTFPLCRMTVICAAWRNYVFFVYLEQLRLYQSNYSV